MLARWKLPSGPKVAAIGDEAAPKGLAEARQTRGSAPQGLTELQIQETASITDPNGHTSLPGAEENHPLARRDRLPAKTIRLRDKEHRTFVSRQPCLLCGRIPTDPHHLRFAQPKALGRRVSDEFTVPVCRLHHREIHRQGDEAAWWKKAGIEPLSAALKLWRQTHPLGATADRRVGEGPVGAPSEHLRPPGEVQRGQIDKTNPFPEVGQP